ncbi:hypothetical protein Patl1_35425 [Pistacia atlantica]|nr:hypothetical protein Patl1_35425 [Pistacia atlantica]
MDRVSSTDKIKGPWSPEEDQLLHQLVQRYGGRNWSLISKSIPGSVREILPAKVVQPAVSRGPAPRLHVRRRRDNHSSACQVRQQVGYHSETLERPYG